MTHNTRRLANIMGECEVHVFHIRIIIPTFPLTRFSLDVLWVKLFWSALITNMINSQAY